MDSNESYGQPRIRAELREQGTDVSGKRTARLMRQSRLRGISRRRGFTVTTRRVSATGARSLGAQTSVEPSRNRQSAERTVPGRFALPTVPVSLRE